MKSMTGFGKGIAENENYQVEVEIKSVNHRFLDIQIRSPKGMNAFDNPIRQAVKERLNRGRVEIFITLTELSDNSKAVKIHWPLVDQLVGDLKAQAISRYGDLDLQITRILEQVVTMPDFVEVTQQELDDDQLEDLVLAAVAQAVGANAESREEEGMAIKGVLENNQNTLAKTVEELSTFNDVYEKDHQEKFQKKLEDFLGEQVDRDRLLTEMALLIERGDIHEELDRMAIHLEKMTQLLASPEPVGRELDFLIQEMNREVNTIGSKSSPIEIKEAVVQMKTIIEKIREQVQNIE